MMEKGGNTLNIGKMARFLLNCISDNLENTYMRMNFKGIKPKGLSIILAKYI